MFTRKEAEDLAQRRRAKEAAAREPQLRAIAQAEVGAKQVTANPAWKWFLQILSAKREAAEASIRAIDNSARSSLDFSPGTLARVQASRIAWQARIDTYLEVMGLPAEIIDNAEKAQEMLKTLKDAETNEKSDSSAAS